jgi:hypothetical protein
MRKNFEVARLFGLMGDALELRGENVFSIRRTAESPPADRPRQRDGERS